MGVSDFCDVTDDVEPYWIQTNGVRRVGAYVATDVINGGSADEQNGAYFYNISV